MPAGDRTGPWGLGPRTGRGLGTCSGFGAPGYLFPGPGLGRGRGFSPGRGSGRGFGIGRGRGFWRPGYAGVWGYPYYSMTPYAFQPGREEESAWLADQAKNLERQLAQVQKRLAELEKEKGAKK
jgi:Family of unknown function (DUF5320)